MAAALAEPPAVGGEGQAGHDDDVERRPGRRRRARRAGRRPSTAGREHGDIVVPAPGEPRRRVRLRRQRLEQHHPLWARRRGPSAPRSAMRRSAPRCGRSGRRRSAGSAAIDRRTARIDARSDALVRHMTKCRARAYHRRRDDDDSDSRRSTRPSSARCSGTSRPASRSSPAWPATSRPGSRSARSRRCRSTRRSSGSCPMVSSDTWQAMAPAGKFCVNVLRDDQADAVLAVRQERRRRRPLRRRHVDPLADRLPDHRGRRRVDRLHGRAPVRARRPLPGRRPGRRPRPPRRPAHAARLLQGRARRLPGRRLITHEAARGTGSSLSPERASATRSRTTTGDGQGRLEGQGQPRARRGGSSSEGVCDGCALGVAGFHDWTLDGVHLCTTRLRLLEVNCAEPFDHTVLARRLVAAQPRLDRAARARPARPPDAPPARRAGLPPDHVGRGARRRRRRRSAPPAATARRST